MKSLDGEVSGEICDGRMGRRGKALTLNNRQGDVGIE